MVTVFAQGHWDFKRLLYFTSSVFQIVVLGETNPLTALVVDLEDVDPDDAFSIVPYEKGSALLWHLEEKVGGAGGSCLETEYIFSFLIPKNLIKIA